MTVDGPMEILAIAAQRYGNVHPHDDDAVIEFLEKNAEKVPVAEAEKLVSALMQRNQSSTAGALGDADAVIPELRFPKLEDARREAKLYRS